MLIISALSIEYIHASVAATSGGVDIDPTADPVAMAFVAQGSQPGVTDWKTGSWLQDVSTEPITHFARALVGPSPGVVTLTAGVWDVFVRISDSPEVPVKKAGSIRVI